MQNRMMSDRKDMIQKSVEVAIGSLNSNYKSFKDGSITEDVAKMKTIELIQNMRYGKDGYFWINDTDYKMIIHPTNSALNGTSMYDFKDVNGFYLYREIISKVKSEDKSSFLEYYWPRPGSQEAVPKISYVQLFAPWNWVLGSGVYIDDINRDIAEIKTKTIGGFGIVCIFSILIFVIFANQTTRVLGNTVVNANTAGEQVFEASEQLASAGQVVSTSASDSARRIQDTLIAVTKLNEIVLTNKDQAHLAFEIATSTRQEAHDGTVELKSLISAINELAKSSSEITQAMIIIDDIAFQTNLLALNAAVEAARAGEQGKGFAVVADAVRGLAQKSAEAAKEVKQVVDNNVIKTKVSLELAGASEKVLAQIVLSVQKMAKINNTISDTSIAQQEEIQMITSAMKGLDSVTQELSSAAEETAATSTELSSQASQLKTMVHDIADEVLGHRV